MSQSTTTAVARTLDAQRGEQLVQLLQRVRVGLAGNALQLLTALVGHHRVLLDHQLDVVLQQLVRTEALTSLQNTEVHMVGS